MTEDAQGCPSSAARGRAVIDRMIAAMGLSPDRSADVYVLQHPEVPPTGQPTAGAGPTKNGYVHNPICTSSSPSQARAHRLR